MESNIEKIKKDVLPLDGEELDEKEIREIEHELKKLGYM